MKSSVNIEPKILIYKTCFLLIILILIPAFKQILAYVRKVITKRNYLNSTLSRIDTMSGIEFEEFLKSHFEKHGYKVSETPKSRDFGVDLIIIKEGCVNLQDSWVIQAKRNKNKIGIKAIQEILGGMSYYSCSNGMVITNSFFTKSAWQLAKISKVTLWDRNKLSKVFDIKN